MTPQSSAELDPENASARVRFSFEGRSYTAVPGQTVAAALLAAGVRSLRRSPADGAPRGMFCAMGICQDCLVAVGDRRVESCRLVASEGLDVRAIA
jgi:aerobic-type carbon monoxide dehydrogenase small subunit (CoxS/CutS family)